MSRFACPACGRTRVEVFHREHSIPTNSCLLLESADEAAAYPRGDLEAGFCPDCGFIMNTTFDVELSEYSSRYEETQGYSARFVAFATELAERWVDKYDLAEKTVFEIGCGKGEFLEYMVRAGAAKAVGIDPGLHPERIDADVASRVECITDFYTADYGQIDADAVICRHTLEHIQPVAQFMRDIRAGIGDRTDTVVLFELPDMQRILDEVAFWDVYYEHCSYFSAGSLARLFRATGFEVTHLELEYDDQYLLIEARPSTTPAAGEPLPLEDDMELLAKGVEHFRVGYEQLLTSWRERLTELHGRGGRAVIWGSGSKGVSFLTNLGLRDAISYAVDINPHKHGMFMAGSGQEIVAPELLVEYRPDLVIVMNPIYTAEIQADLDRLGVEAELVAV